MLKAAINPPKRNELSLIALEHGLGNGVHAIGDNNVAFRHADVLHHISIVLFQ